MRIFGRLFASKKDEKKPKNTYAGASSSRLNSGWGAGSVPAHAHLLNSLPLLRSRSREQYRNNDYARRFIAMCKTNIVGHNGIVLQAQIKDLSGKSDTVANTAIENLWADWSLDCDVTGRMTLAEMLRLIVATVAVDGECLVRRISSGKHAFQLKIVDPELLDVRYNVVLSGGRSVRMGVEMDQHGRALAYYLLTQSPIAHASSYQTGKRLRVPADEMWHLYLSEQVDQIRGVPWMSSALSRMKSLNGYEEAAVIAARIGASKMGFFHAKEGEGIQPLADEETATGDFIQDADPGTFEVLPDGYDFTTFNPDYPHQQFSEFVKATLRGISSGLGVAYNGLANDLEGVNFSSIRAGVQEEREQWKVLQEWLISGLMRPLFESWLSTQLALGTLTVPAKGGGRAALPASKFERFKRVSFQGRRWAWVDPLKDLKASELALQLNLKSRSDIIREMGRDPDEVWREIERENKEMISRGLSSEIVEGLNEKMV